jgi:hypothetical protein
MDLRPGRAGCRGGEYFEFRKRGTGCEVRSAELRGVFAGRGCGEPFFASSWRVQPGRVRATGILATFENNGLEPRSGDPRCGVGENAQVSRRGTRDPVDGIAPSVLRDSVSDCGDLAGPAAHSPETGPTSNALIYNLPLLTVPTKSANQQKLLREYS